MPAKYIRLANQLKELLLQNTGNGIYKLPSEHALCQQYHVSRQTVRAALRLLSEEGLVEKRQGSGSFSTGHSIAENNIGVILNNALPLPFWEISGLSSGIKDIRFRFIPPAVK